MSGDQVMTARGQRPDQRFVAAQRARGMSWAAIGGLMGCGVRAAEARYGDGATASRRNDLWNRHAPEAEALTQLLDEEGAPGLVGAIYLVVLHRWLSERAGPAERAALVAWDAPLANTLTDRPPVTVVPPPPAEDWRVIGREVAADHDLTLADIMSRARSARVCFARHAFWWRLWMLRRGDGSRRFGLAGIARIAGRDHATVREGLIKHARREGLGLDGLS